MYIATCNLSELQVACNVGRDENVGELAVGHEELRYKIDVPVVRSAVLLPWLFALTVVAIFLEQLRGVSLGGIRCVGRLEHTYSRFTEADSLDGCQLKDATHVEQLNLPSIVVVPINVQNFLSLHTQNTLLRQLASNEDLIRGGQTQREHIR